MYGGADTKYLSQAPTDREKRNAVGVYAESGLSGYTVEKDVNPSNNTAAIGAQGPGFPVTWDPRWVYAAGTVAFPDHREGFAVNESAPRLPAVADETLGYVVNTVDQPDGFLLGTNLFSLRLCLSFVDTELAFIF